MSANNRGHRAKLVFAIVSFQLLVDVAILINVPIARQVLGFIYLTFVPGTILLILFRLYSLNFVEKFLFSIGLSLVFVILLGLAVNQIGLWLEPLAVLSTPILLIAMNSGVFSLCVLNYFLNRNIQWNKKKLDFPLPWLLTICFPLLAILGTILVNFNGSNVILLLMIGIIAVTALISSAVARAGLPLILFMITIAVLFHGSLISNYIFGHDIHSAYHVFKTAQNKGVWTQMIEDTDPNNLRYNQMLIVTIFPVIYSNMLNLEGTWIFKIVFPLMFALVPVGLYQLYQKYTEKKVAFVAAFLIFADITFFREMPGLPPQMIAELFLVLLLIVLFREEISQYKRIFFFTIFSAGMIVSHYGISYLFMFLLLFGWLVPFLRKKQSKIRMVYIILFFVLAFSWYIYTTQSVSFTSLVDMGQNIYTSFWTDLLNPESRPKEVMRGLGIGEPAISMGHWVGRVFRYGTEFFIVLGFLAFILKRTRAYNSLKLHREYVAMSGFMLASLLLILVVPSANLLNTTRLYHVSILFLAPFCIIGGNKFFSILPKLSKSQSYIPFILTSIVVTSLFLFETGFVYEVTGDVSYSIPLSMHRVNREVVYGKGFITKDVDVAGAKWLNSNMDSTSNTIVYADVVSTLYPLTSYAVLPRRKTQLLTNATSFDLTPAYVYLREFNTFDGKILGPGFEFPSKYVWNTSDVSLRLEVLNKIYSNGGSEIFFALNKTSS